MRKALKMYSVVCLTGFEGSGKTTLVKDFLARNQLTNFWITLSNFLTLSDVAGTNDSDTDAAISKIIERLRNEKAEFIVWDNVHFLNFANQQKLIFRLAESQLQQKLILISDEKIEALNDIPIIKIPGLSVNQIKGFLEFFDATESQEAIEEIHLKTAGLPLLIKQWILNPAENFFNEHFNKSLDKKTDELLKLLSFTKTTLSTDQVKEFMGSEVDQNLQMLKNKFLIEINSENKILVVEAFKRSVYAKLTAAEKQKLSSALTDVFSKRKEISPVLKLCFALGGNRSELYQKISDEISLDDLEQLTQENLNDLVALLGAIDKNQYHEERHYQLGRLFIHGLVLLNRRSEAIDFCKQTIESINWQNESDNFFWFSYDLIYWLNRSKYSEVTQPKISKLSNLAKRPMSFLFQVELSFSLSQQTQKFADSISSLKRIRKEILDRKDQDKITKLALANVDYQIGILMMEIKDFSGAIEYFENAKENFKQINRKYFELFSEFNVCINLSYLFEHRDLVGRLEKLRVHAQLNGYSYLISGVCLLMSEFYFSNLQNTQALDYIEKATEMIDPGMPHHSRFAIECAKLRILKDLGLDDLVRENFKRLKVESSKQDEKALKRIALELQIDFEKAADFQEKWLAIDSENYDAEFLEMYLLQRGIEPSDFKKHPSTNKSLRFELAQAEQQIISAIRAESTQNTEDQMRSLENLLRKTNEDRIEKAALICLQMHFQKDVSEAMIQKGQVYVQKISANASTKAFFKSWIEAIKNKAVLQESIEFGNVQEAEMERWLQWVPRPQKKKYTLFSNNSSVEVEEELKTIPPVGIYLNESQKQLYVNGKANKLFEKKPILIQILAILMSHSPEHLSKMSLSALLWTESYDPSTHDTRIYTSIQRIRTILGNDIIENWKGGYRWSSRMNYFLLRSNEIQGFKQNKIATLFVEALRSKRRNKNEQEQWIGKKELVEIAETSDATAKRVLANLLKDGQIEKKGSGSMVVYRLVK